jgi:hypothetical protein
MGKNGSLTTYTGGGRGLPGAAAVDGHDLL